MRRSAGAWSGKTSEVPCDPEFCLETGCRFPDGAQPESTSQFGTSKRDALSARQNRRDCVSRWLRYSPRISAASSS